jgi:crossover junction endodeoxyribonuclease RuvC
VPYPGALTILGIDPGLTVTGYGVVFVESIPKGRYRVLDFGAVTPDPRAPRAERLLCIHEALTVVIRQYRPAEAAVEDFIVGHSRAAVAVGEARAAAVLAAAQAGVPVAMYTPLEIKRCVSTYGRGSKEQVGLMVQALLGLDEPPTPADAADALAAALCHLLRRAGHPSLASVPVPSTRRPGPRRRVP